MPAQRNLFIAFDAFGTLFRPRRPIEVQYGAVARKHGLSGFTRSELQASFRSAFKDELFRHPNYGQAVGMNAGDWWSNVVTKTFTPFRKDDQPLPAQLIPSLLTRFSSRKGYALYPDVLPLFQAIRSVNQRDPTQRIQQTWNWNNIVVAIVTNSDDRVLGILQSLGLKVRPRRYHTLDDTRREYHSSSSDYDISFVVLSYDVGYSKPDRRIFQVAQEMLANDISSNDANGFEMLFVGDDYAKDVCGAEEAGWNAVYLDRDSAWAGPTSRQEPVTLDAATYVDAPEGKLVRMISDLAALGHWQPDQSS